MTKQPDLYKILQVDAEAEPEVVTAAYRRLAAKYHPDVNKAPDAGERMRALNDAYAVIGDAGKRLDYDRQRTARPRARTTGARPVYRPVRRTSPAIIVTPSVLSFGSIAKGTTRTLTLQISVSEGRTVIGDLHASHPWIRLSANRLFSANAVVNVQIDATGLKEGVHNGTITIESISYGSRAVPVSVRVEPQARPILIVTPGILDFGRAVAGRSPKTQSIRISNGGPGLLSGTMSSRQKWLSVSQNTWSGNQAVLQVIADASGLRAGRVYRGELELSSNGGKFMIAAHIQVIASDALVPHDDGRAGAANDLAFLRERMLILKDLRSPTALQESEQIVITHLLHACKGGDVAVALQRAIEGAQGWRDQAYLAEGIPLSANLLPVLNDLFARLRRYETQEG